VTCVSHRTGGFQTLLFVEPIKHWWVLSGPTYLLYVVTDVVEHSVLEADILSSGQEILCP